MSCSDFANAQIGLVAQVDGRVDVAFVQLSPAEVLIAKSDGVWCCSPDGVLVSGGYHFGERKN